MRESGYQYGANDTQRRADSASASVRQQHHKGQEASNCSQRPFGRFADHGESVPTVFEAVGPALIPANECQQFPLRTWQAAFCGDASEPMRHVPVMRGSVRIPFIPIGGSILQYKRVVI
jgi:hypothetical protein